MLKKISVRRKLTLLTALLVVSMGTLATLFAAWLAYNNTRESMRAEGIELANLYQHSLLNSWRLGDEYQVYELISAPFHTPDASRKTDHTEHIQEIVLLDDNGRVLSASHPKRFPIGSEYALDKPDFPYNIQTLKQIQTNAATQLLETDKEDFFVLAPVGENGVKYANMVLGYQPKDLLANVLDQVRRTFVVILLATLLMALLARAVANRFSLPLYRLSEKMREFARVQGLKMDHENTATQDEIVQLEEVFGDLEQKLSGMMNLALLRDEEQRAYLQTLDLLQDAVIELTPDGRLLRATDAWKDMTGINDVDDFGLIACVHHEDIAEVLEQFSALVHEQKQQLNIRFRLHRDEDTHCWVEGRFAAIRQNNQVTSIRGVVRDISSTYLHERQISHMAMHDALTNLPNRILLDDRLEMAISRAARSNQRVALGFIDIDHFKQVNDNFGHKIGDRLLKEVSQRLGLALRSTDTLSRWGGDEFVVLCPDLNSLQDAKDITQKLALLTREHITIEDTEFPFSFSAGFAVYPDDASDSEMLLAQADRAMFYAKAQGRNNIQFFNTIAGKETGRQSFYIQSRLSTAIHNNQILAWLQPLISAQTGEVIGAEVLARWHEAEQGWIPPSVFIPMAESLGLIDKLGQSVWQQALCAFPRLPADHRLSVNLSKRQLFSSTIVQQFCDDIRHAGIKPRQIMLEITEGLALSDVEYARERIAELDAQGFGIAIDDFGTGYSSLSQLHEIPADELKLDISFVRRIHEKSGLGIATAILSIAKSLNLECVAEGVEDAQTAALLTDMGVEILQGYHFAKPMPIDEYVTWLAARKNLRA
ncbi:MAG: EAL domain-containing protein [Gallionella sp.]|jgi:diguanylate cyclase (GGDEF)-like protein/PAS domain S-box-containing protein